MPNKSVKFLVPKIWATIPFVAGTVASHNKPNEVPNKTADKFEAGRKMKSIKAIPLKKYKPLNRIFLLYLSPSNPL